MQWVLYFGWGTLFIMLFFRDFRLGVLLNFLKQRHIMDFLLWTRYQRYKLEISFFITRVYCNQYYRVRVFVRRYVSPVYKHSVQTHLFTNLFSILHCYHQRKIRWLERDLNSHLRVSRPPLYPLSYRVNGDWWRVLSNLSGRNILATT